MGNSTATSMPGRRWKAAATAAEAWYRLSPERRRVRRWVLVATAHAAKFREIVEPLIGRPVALPDSLTKLFARPAQCVEIAATLDAVRQALQEGG
ncbi:MAG TPA: hypothetical protein VE258_14550 [Ktedonobacterales bacterium]|nr:hypothetical protein [Ktedonobacterales bacterium]